MAVNQNVFLHETDRSAMEALKAIPGFSQVTKTFMNSWNEKIMYIENMASNVRISEEQLPHIYAMLKPICKKLDIDVPDLFLKLDVVPNAYTSGETRPFIVITSGLLEIMPEELLPTVLAHECGHIACHHVLYRTMGTWLLSGTLSMIPLSIVAIYPIMTAFYHWMRCSELSADRAAALCTSPDAVIDMCMRFAGFGSCAADEMNREAFLKQAQEYRQLVNEGMMNKAMEFMRFSRSTHPISALRASECLAWTQSDNYIRARHYFEARMNGAVSYELPVSWNSKTYTGRNYEEVRKELEELGFGNLVLQACGEKGLLMKSGDVVSVCALQKEEEGSRISSLEPVTIRYYAPQSTPVKEDSGLIALKHSNAYFTNRNYSEAVREFEELGFADVEAQPLFDLEDPKDSAIGRIITIRIDDSQIFRKNDVYSKDAAVCIIYHACAQDNGYS